MRKNVLLMIALILTIAYYFYQKGKTVEGATFSQCRSKGFSKEFCLQTPASLKYGPATCKCDDGRMGKIIPGFRGECCCDESCLTIN